MTDYLSKTYGLLTYHHTRNLGDEVQSIAARRFLPHIDYYIDRDQLSLFKTSDHSKVKVICNGWYSHHPENWPPSNDISPLLISMHFALHNGLKPHFVPREIMLSEPLCDYLRAHGPVGARDLETLEILQEKNIPSYYSGCITLTLEKKGFEKQNDLIVLHDVPDEVVLHIRKKTDKKILLVNFNSNCNIEEQRFTQAENLLQLYEQASCVITTRLHAALPSLALETPVFLLDIAQDQERFKGLNQLVNHASVDVFLENDALFDVNNPPLNSKQYLSLKYQIEDTVKNFINNDISIPDIPNLTQARLNSVMAYYLSSLEQFEKDKNQLQENLNSKINEIEAIQYSQKDEIEAIQYQLALSQKNEKKLLKNLKSRTYLFKQFFKMLLKK